MLARWLQTALREAGGSVSDPTLVSDEAVNLLLDLAREAAHGVARPAAPLATFAAGLALGRSGGDLGALRAAVERIQSAAAGWPAPDEGGDGQPGG